MKRLGLTLVTALCLAASTFAAGNQPTTAKWEGNINGAGQDTEQSYTRYKDLFHQYASSQRDRYPAVGG